MLGTMHMCVCVCVRALARAHQRAHLGLGGGGGVGRALGTTCPVTQGGECLIKFGGY